MKIKVLMMIGKMKNKNNDVVIVSVPKVKYKNALPMMNQRTAKTRINTVIFIIRCFIFPPICLYSFIRNEVTSIIGACFPALLNLNISQK